MATKEKGEKKRKKNEKNKSTSTTELLWGKFVEKIVCYTNGALLTDKKRLKRFVRGKRKSCYIGWKVHLFQTEQDVKAREGGRERDGRNKESRQ